MLIDKALTNEALRGSTIKEGNIIGLFLCSVQRDGNSHCIEIWEEYVAFDRPSKGQLAQARKKILVGRRSHQFGHHLVSILWCHPFQVTKDIVTVHRWGSGSLRPLVCDQGGDLCACYTCELCRDLLRAVTLNMPVLLAKVAESFASFFVVWVCGSTSCRNRVYFVDLHRGRRRR